MASNITVSALTATPGIGHILLKPTVSDPNSPGGHPYRKLKHVQLWSHTANDRGSLDGSGNPTNATLVDAGVDKLVHLGLTDQNAQYYWARAIDVEGSQGAFYPSSQTAGIEGKTFSDNNEWTEWTPTVTPQTGTFTAASGFGLYKLAGKMCFYQVDITIGLPGNGGGAVRFTLPLPASENNHTLGLARTNGGSSALCVCTIDQDATMGFIYTYQFTSVISQVGIFANGMYEIA